LNASYDRTVVLSEKDSHLGVWDDTRPTASLNIPPSRRTYLPTCMSFLSAALDEEEEEEDDEEADGEGIVEVVVTEVDEVEG
jgi:hypothetical protein